MIVVLDSFTWATFRRRYILEEIADLVWQKGRDSWQGKNTSRVPKAVFTVVAAGEHHISWA